MRKQTTVLLILMVLSGVIAILHFLPQPVPVPDSPNEPVAQPYIFRLPAPQETPFSRDLLRKRPLPNLPLYSSRSEPLPEKLANKALPKLLAGKEGSYTNLTDLFKGNESPSVDLRSDWIASHLFPNRTLPLLQMRINEDPDTGEYRISGGALTLPDTGFEAGYEAGLNNDERKATLQWKKSF
jgi:hypothetical protein